MITTGDTEIFVPTTSGTLECRFYKSQNNSSNHSCRSVIILPPNPYFGGNMNNKTVYAMYRIFKDMGFSTMRINYCGTGKSRCSLLGNLKEENNTSEYKKLMEETNLQAISSSIDWIRSELDFKSRIWISGFSFGSWLSLQSVMRRPEIVGFVSLAPPVGLYDFSFFAPCPTPGIFIHGENDKIISCKKVVEMVKVTKARSKVDIGLKIVKNADHMFTNHAEEINSIITNYIKKTSFGDDMDSLLGQGKGKNKIFA